MYIISIVLLENFSTEMDWIPSGNYIRDPITILIWYIPSLFPEVSKNVKLQFYGQYVKIKNKNSPLSYMSFETMLNYNVN